MKEINAFISSTAKELRDERLVVKQALTNRNIKVFVFELDAGARPDAAQEAFLEEVAEADLYIGIFWNQYSDPTISEFKYAKKLSKPCLVYVKNFDIHRDAQLTEFLKTIADVTTGLTIRYFDNIIELSDFVTHDAQNWLVRDWRSKSEHLILSKVERQYLEKDYKQMLNLTQLTDIIEINDTEGVPPFRYMLRFLTDGVVNIDKKENPVIKDKHIVEILLHDNYPRNPPHILFHTPLFHPNISPSGVCLGWFEIPYKLADVCIHLVKMVDYQIFNLKSPLNGEAAKWAESHREMFPLRGLNIVLSEKDYGEQDMKNNQDSLTKRCT